MLCTCDTLALLYHYDIIMVLTVDTIYMYKINEYKQSKKTLARKRLDMVLAFLGKSILFIACFIVGYFLIVALALV